MAKVIKTKFGRAKIYRPGFENSGEPLLVVPGYSETLTHVRKLTDILAGHGFRAFTFSPPRKGGNVKKIDPISRQSKIIHEILDAEMPDGQKVIAAAHSFAVAAVLQAAQAAPERFSQLILMQPLGLTGKQGLNKLLRRAGKKTFNNHMNAIKSARKGALRHVTMAHFAALRVLAKQPVLALREGRAASRYDIAEDISQVTALGILVHIVVSDTDEFFDKVKLEATRKNISVRATTYRKFGEEYPGHDAFWIYHHSTVEIICWLLKKS